MLRKCKHEANRFILTLGQDDNTYYYAVIYHALLHSVNHASHLSSASCARSLLVELTVSHAPTTALPAANVPVEKCSQADRLTSSRRNDEEFRQLISGLLESMRGAIGEIEQVNFQTKLLSLNARIEAARAGGIVGAAFGIVAQEIQSLSQHTSHVTERLAENSQSTILEIRSQVERFSQQANGDRSKSV